MRSAVPVLLSLAAFVPMARAHIAFWHNSMYGFNVTQQDFDYDNRPVTPFINYSFQQWWFHNHLSYPPEPGAVFNLPAGQAVNAELSCDKGATSWYASSQGGLAGYPTNWPCPGQASSEFHTLNINDTRGCALAIAYKPNATDVQPDDFVVFSVNHTCVWDLNTAFQVPAGMPPCPEGKCTCAWFWIHSADSGAEQNYMNGFSCNVTDTTSTTPIGKPMLPRRCGEDPDFDEAANPGNCTIGPKYPMYWYQAEGNNMFEGTYMPPAYNSIYGFKDGAQDDIFQDAYVSSLGSSSAGIYPSATPVSKRADGEDVDASLPPPVTTPAPLPTPVPAEHARMHKHHKRLTHRD
ncbi:uncharacterized protein FIBRA_06501 [Fibroporia radiculosa]|uniref:Lytic polysaccharide monooxygenase n=1 Tax=Fibroporia radiculosa TaxID=599839 RepID=J4GSV2_9APHY|nr:uncharacterized protein FIBRA_06501 [Fibroporia radiculosa]CCM04330.1 predicted protein [Fibroporia radiculosa]